MNFKLKALVAAAVVATTMSGAANALTNNDIFLVAYDATASKTFVAALGQAGTAQAFTGSTNLSINYAADANWVNLMSTATAGSVSYQVLGFYNADLTTNTSFHAGDKMLVTSQNTPGSLGNSAFTTLMADLATASGGIAQFESLNAAITGTSTGLVSGTGFDSGAAVGTNVFTKYNGFNATAALGTDLGFYSITRPASSSNLAQTVKTAYLTNGVGSPIDTWNLSSTGQLVYTAAATAAVPEADSWAMAMLGLGLMGFVARRRTRA